MASKRKRDNFSGLYQSLAATNKKTRARAFSKLQLWLRGSTKVDSAAMLKLWKALFYCMYMCDKTGPQQQLAEDFAALALHFRLDAAEETTDQNTYDQDSFDRAFLFVQTFFTTIVREFSGLDQHRKDKFLSLIRKMFHGLLLLTQSHGWHKTVLAKVENLLEQILQIGSKSIPNVLRVTADVRLQICDVCVTELKKVSGKINGKIPNKAFLAILKPFLLYAATGQHTPTMERVYDNVLNMAVDSIDAFPLVNVSQLQACIFDFATASSTPESKRRRLFQLHKRFKRVIRGRVIGKKGRLRPTAEFDELGAPAVDESGSSCEEDDNMDNTKSSNKDQDTSLKLIDGVLQKELKHAETASAAIDAVVGASVKSDKSRKYNRKHAIKARNSRQTLIIEGLDDDDETAAIVTSMPRAKQQRKKDLKMAAKRQAEKKQKELDEEQEALEAAAKRQRLRGDADDDKRVRFSLKDNVEVTTRKITKKMRRRAMRDKSSGADNDASPVKGVLKSPSPKHGEALNDYEAQDERARAEEKAARAAKHKALLNSHIQRKEQPSKKRKKRARKRHQNRRVHLGVSPGPRVFSSR